VDVNVLSNDINMKTKTERLEIIKNHYKKWSTEAKNPDHRKYARKMYESVLNGTYKETFEEEGSYRFITESGRRFRTLEDLALAFKTSRTNMAVNYKRYGVKKIKK